MLLVKARREEAGLTLTEAARRADMLCSKVWKIENDQRRLTLVDAARLAAAIGCDLEDFLPGRVPAALGRQE
jgi:transcriptional regulator with XRE-family HTH domain